MNYVFIHGVNQHPAVEDLDRDWCLWASAGSGRPIRTDDTEWVYYSDHFFGASEPRSGDGSSLEVRFGAHGPDDAVIPMPSPQDEVAVNALVEAHLDELERHPEYEAELALARDLEAAGLDAEPLISDTRLGRLIIKKVFRQVYLYIENKDFTSKVDGDRAAYGDFVRDMAVGTIAAAAADGPVTVVGHSKGSVVAYDAIRSLGPGVAVDHLVTIGSPLGIDYIFNGLDIDADTAVPDGLRRWTNVRDGRDPVVFGQRVRDKYLRAGQAFVEEFDVDNGFGLSNRHKAQRYLEQPVMQSVLRAAPAG